MVCVVVCVLVRVLVRVSVRVLARVFVHFFVSVADLSVRPIMFWHGARRRVANIRRRSRFADVRRIPPLPRYL
jgi:hypothetical protein